MTIHGEKKKKVTKLQEVKFLYFVFFKVNTKKKKINLQGFFSYNELSLIHSWRNNIRLCQGCILKGLGLHALLIFDAYILHLWFPKYQLDCLSTEVLLSGKMRSWSDCLGLVVRHFWQGKKFYPSNLLDAMYDLPWIDFALLLGHFKYLRVGWQSNSCLKGQN